jgi:hypothetical protein
MEIPADADDGAEYSHEEYAAAAAAPAGASLEELLQAGPSMLDQMLLARTQPRQDTQNQPPPLMSTQRARQGYQAPLSRRQGTMPSYGPGSRTRPVGVNDMAIGGNTMGDGRGNVLRDNMRHFGIVGSRSR